MLEGSEAQSWTRAKGYANGFEARGRKVFVAGMIGWNGRAQFETDGFAAQCRQVLQKIVHMFASAQQMARITWYVKDKKNIWHTAKRWARSPKKSSVKTLWCK